MASTIRTQIIEGVKRGAADPIFHDHRIYNTLMHAPNYTIFETAFLTVAHFPEPLLALSLPGQLATLPKTMSRIKYTRKESLEAHYLALSPSSASLSAPASSSNKVEEEEAQPEAEEDASVEKQQASRKIQAWLQRRIAKRRSTTRFDAFIEMQDEVKKLGSNATIRRSVLLLGPLVHLYHALVEAQRLLRNRKKELGRELGSVIHLELDRVIREQNEARCACSPSQSIKKTR